MYKILILCLLHILFTAFTANSQCSVEVNNNGFEYNVDIELEIIGAIYTQSGSTCNVEIEVEYDIQIEVINQPGWWSEELYVLQGNLDCAGGSGTSFFDLPNGGGSGTETSATFSYSNEDCGNVILDCPITIQIQGPELNETIDCGLFLREALPVMLSEFKIGDRNKNDLQLEWTTHSEINFSHFELLTSYDLKDWNTEAVVKGKNSLSGGIYNHLMDRSNQDIYTRLKMVDIDGSYEYSDLLFIESREQEALSIYPNPTKDLLFFEGMQVEHVTITNSMGQVSQFIIDEIQYLDVSSLAKGFYFIQAQNSSGISQSLRFLKQ